MRHVTIFLFAGLWIGLTGGAEAEFLASSRHFALHSDYSIRDTTTWADRASEQEATTIGQLMDTIYDRYLSLGFSPARLSRDENGKMRVNLLRRQSVNSGGSFSFGMDSSWGYIAKENSFINLNITQFRSSVGRFSHTIAHEIFHSLQYATLGGANVMDAGIQGAGDFDKVRHDWLIEGTADAAGFLAADGVGGFVQVPGRFGTHFDLTQSGPRKYSGPLHMDSLSSFPILALTNDRFESYRLQTYYTSSFWRFVSQESNGLGAFKILFSGSPGKNPTPLTILEWVHDNIKRLPQKSGSGLRFPAGLPQAFTEFVSEFADLPFITKYGKFRSTGNMYDDGVWQKVVFARQGRDECEMIDLSPGVPQVSASVWIDRFASTCFRVSLAANSPASAFRINVSAAITGEENYVCQAIALGSNGVTVATRKAGGLVSGPGACTLQVPVLYAPRTNMSHQNVILTNVHARGGSGSIGGTKDVEVRVDFVLGAATASGTMSPSQQSSSAAPAPPAPGAPAASPSSASTGKNVSVKSTSARARGKQRQHATASQKTDCSNWPDRCPQIEIDLAQYDGRFETIAAMGNSLGAGALVALDGAQRQLNVIGLYGNPEKLGAMAVEMAGSEFTEVGIRIRAPEGRIERGMRWDDAVITALVGTMGGDEHTGMSSRGPYPTPGSCLSDPAATGTVEITEVGGGWVSGTFSADLYENYVQRPWKDACAARPSNGRVSGTFTAPYEDITQPPVDPKLAAYQVWAGLPAMTWAVTDYDDLVEQAIATQRDLLRDWEVERGTSGGGGVGGPSPTACAQECFPGVLGCPNISADEVERLTPIYLSTLPASMRDTMRQQIERASPEAQSRLLAIGMDVKGCMDAPKQP